ncbi:glycosyltransferase family 2 protein [Altericista sp. CCNU0014]|uniref:glycosyltransferase family 2 protein n=1 Tax=Altericista sp. CCNU0014 TaxID=3082949 RepID=UPI00384F019B
MNFSPTTLIAVLSGILAVALGGLGLVLLGEVWAAKAVREDTRILKAPALLPRIAVLIPAYNEELNISATVRSLLPELRPCDRLIAIADNCCDRTAEVARQAGAFVLERTDAARKGKGYALDYGLEFLANNPPEIVVFMDADCTVSPGSIEILAKTARKFRRPVQSTYLMEQPAEPTLRDRISVFALTLKNLVRPLGMKALGWPCLLTGSGMAVPWALLAPISLAGNRNADDMQLTVDLALQGASPIYEPRSRVMGRLMLAEDAYSQRTRWEHGHLRMILTQVPRLLKAVLVQRRFDLLILACDMAIPPLSLFMLLWIGLVFLNLGALGIGLVNPLSFILSLLAGLPIVLGVWTAWHRFGRTLLPSQNWMEIPSYLFWKAPIYIKFAIRPQTRWLKTERDAVEPSDPL